VSHEPLLVRRPAVAGTFYPSDERSLRALLRRCFDDAVPPPLSAPVPTALVVPHAGYVYSGPVAASAYLRLVPGRGTIRRVVLIGPSHRVAFRGIALSGAGAWATPLGVVEVDANASDVLAPFPFVRVVDAAHADEHCLEVQLPFLQTVLDEFAVIPLVVGDASVAEVAAVIDALWSGHDTLVVVSTDLSHYHRYVDAIRIDARTAQAIADLRSDDITADAACGSLPLRGLLRAAADRHRAIEQIDLRNSGDTSGDRNRVVGYGAFALS
jgi:AmmeMemoRadiSam system protein B